MENEHGRECLKKTINNQANKYIKQIHKKRGNLVMSSHHCIFNIYGIDTYVKIILLILVEHWSHTALDYPGFCYSVLI